MGATRETATPIALGEQTSVSTGEVWYSLKPATSALVLVDTRNSSATDTVVEVFVDRGGDVELYRNGDDDVDTYAVLGMQVFAEYTYYVQVKKFDVGEAGTLGLVLTELALGALPIKAEVDPDPYSSLPQIDRMVLSPDGSKVAAVLTTATQPDLVQEIWVGVFDPTQETMASVGRAQGPLRYVATPAWLDNDCVVAVAGQGSGDGTVASSMIVARIGADGTLTSQSTASALPGFPFDGRPRRNSDSSVTVPVYFYDQVSPDLWGEVTVTISGLTASSGPVTQLGDTLPSGPVSSLGGSGWLNIVGGAGVLAHIYRPGQARQVITGQTSGRDYAKHDDLPILGDTIWLPYADESTGKPFLTPVSLVSGTAGAALSIPLDASGTFGDFRGIEGTSFALALFGSTPGRWVVARIDLNTGTPALLETFELGDSSSPLSYDAGVGKRVVGRMDTGDVATLSWLAHVSEDREFAGFDRDFFYLRNRATVTPPVVVVPEVIIGALRRVRRSFH